MRVARHHMRIVRQRKAVEAAAPQAAKIGAPGTKRVHFDARMDISAPDAKAFEVVKGKDGKVEDYQNVVLKGYLATFGNTDRQGETVLPGAFTDTIPQFMRNPVLLINHRNDACSVVGNFKTVREDNVGLYVEAMLSNSPGEECLDVRFKVAEGILRTLSMGGIFHFMENQREIFKVDLWEGSIVALPANPQALISTRQLTADELHRSATVQ